MESLLVVGIFVVAPLGAVGVLIYLLVKKWEQIEKAQDHKEDVERQKHYKDQVEPK